MKKNPLILLTSAVVLIAVLSIAYFTRVQPAVNDSTDTAQTETIAQTVNAIDSSSALNKFSKLPEKQEQTIPQKAQTVSVLPASFKEMLGSNATNRAYWRAVPLTQEIATHEANGSFKTRWKEATLISQWESDVDNNGRKRRVTLFQPSDLPYPVRQAEILKARADGQGFVQEQRIETVANRILVRMDASASEADALAAVGLDASNAQARQLSKMGIFRVEFNEIAPDALPAVLEDAGNASSLIYSEPDYIVYPSATPNDPHYTDGSLWGMHNTGQQSHTTSDMGVADADIDAPEAWDIRTDASSVIVGLIDTGVRYTHEDLAANMWKNPGETGLDAFGNDKATNGLDDDGNGFVDDVYGINAITMTGDPMDDNSHGTHCAGTIGGVGNNGKGVVGVAWTTQIMALKFLGASGGSVSDALTCLQYAIDKGATLTSNSWGGPGASQSFEDLLKLSRDAGQLFVVAAANDAEDNDIVDIYPSDYKVDNVLSIAATERDDTLAYFSNYGSGSVDIGAPGHQIISCYYSDDVSYKTYSGTSMATPMTAGLAALVHAEFPSADYAAVKNRILSSGRPLADLEEKTISGKIINAYNALLTTSDAPFNDDFANAREIYTDAESVRASNWHATQEIGESAIAGVGTKTVWWKFTAENTGTTVISTVGSNFDTVLGIYQGAAVGSLTEIASNNDDAGYTYSRVSFEVTAGQEYYIAVGGNAGDEGLVILNMSGPPEEDYLTDAITIPYFPFIYYSDNTNASKEVGEQNHAGNSGGGSLWLKLIFNDSTREVILTTIGSNYDTLLAVYTSEQSNPTFGEMTLVAENDDDSRGFTSSIVSFTAEQGKTYWIVTDGKDNDRGVVKMRGYSKVVNDDFADRLNHNGDSLTIDIAARDRFYATREWNEPDHDNDSSGFSLWYSWTPNTAGDYLITSNGPTALGVYTGNAINALSLVAPDLSDGSSVSRVKVLNAQPGTQYHIAVDARAGTTGFFDTQITIGELVELPNDFIRDAIELTGTPTVADPLTITGHNHAATKESGETSYYHNTVWYKWTAPESGSMTAYLGNIPTSDFAMAVHESADANVTTVGATTEINISNDAAMNNEPWCWFDAVAGQTYYFRVGTLYEWHQTSEFELFIKPFVPVPNDHLADAEELTHFFVQRKVYPNGATRETGEPDHTPNDGTPWGLSPSRPTGMSGAHKAYHTMWYKWTPTAAEAGNYTAFSGHVSNTSTIIGLYEGPATGATYGNLTNIVNSGYTELLWSHGEVHWTPVLGKTYYIVVGTWYDYDQGLDGAFSELRLSFNQNPNDDIADAMQMTGESWTDIQGNYAATVESNERKHGGEAGGRSLWYKWTAPSSGTYQLDTFGTIAPTHFYYDGTDPNEGRIRTKLGVYTGNTIGTLSSTLVKDTGDVSPKWKTSLMTFQATAGTEYHIVIDAEVGTTTPAGGANDTLHTPRAVYQLNLQKIAPAANDDLTDAKEISGTYHQEFVDLKNASRESGEPTHGGRSRGSLWWKWTAPDSGTYFASTVSDTIDAQDERVPGIAVYSGPATVIGFGDISKINEGNNSSFKGNNAPARAQFSASAGQTYYFAVDFGSDDFYKGYKSGFLLAKRPPNDNIANATELTLSRHTVSGYSMGATEENGEPTIEGSWKADGAQNGSIWWKWIAPSSGTTTVSTWGSTAQNALGVYTGTPGSLSEVTKEITQGSPDNGYSYEERMEIACREVSFNATAGTAYYIQVDSGGSDREAKGLVRLTITGQPGIPLTPSNFTGTRVTASRMDFSWTDNAVDEARYVIERKLYPGGSWSQVFNSGEENVTAWTDFSSSESNDWLYRLRAENSAGVSEWVSFATINNDAPVITMDAPTVNTVYLQSVSDVLSLNATVTDDGVPSALVYTWTKVSGPGTVTFSSASAEDTTADFSAVGEYVIRLTADDSLATDTHEITVHVGASEPDNTLLVHYKMDDSSGSTATDSSGNGNTGNLTGTGTWTAGKVDGAIAFDGMGIAYVETSSSIAATNATGLSISSWVKLDALPSTDSVKVAQQQNGGSTGRSWLNITPAGALQSYVGGSETIGGSLTTGQWYHVAITAGSGTVTLYINGQSVASTAYSIEDNTAAFRLGNHKTGSEGLERQLDGAIDDVRIYAGVLTSGEVVGLATVADNLAPVVNAGTDATVSAGVSIALAGSATDDGLPNPPAALSYAWSQVSGADTAVFANASSPTSNVTFPAVGTYVLRLTVSDGAVSVSDEVTYTAAGSPVSLSASETAPAEVTLTWPDTSGETGYEVKQRLSGSGSWTSVTTAVAADATSYVITGLTYGAAYEFAVNALDGATPRVGATTSLTLATSPASLSAEQTGDYSVTLTWADTVNESGYEVKRRLSGSGSWTVVTTAVAANATSYVVSGLTRGQAYQFAVSALDGATPRMGATTSLTLREGFIQGTGAANLVVIEAENYSSKSDNGSGDNWTTTTAFANYTGNSAMQVTADDGNNWTSAPEGSAPVLNFKVDFKQTGTHYIILRAREPDVNGSGGDSLHIGINGVMPATGTFVNRRVPETWEIGNSFQNIGFLNDTTTRVSVEVPTVGVHTIHVWPREDGVIVDRIVITTDINYMPTGSEAESEGGPSTLTAMQLWRQGYFGTTESTGNAADTADPDGDGLANLMEYALASSPNDPSVGPEKLPIIVESGGNHYLEFRLGQSSADINYTVEFSRDLSNWTSPAPVSITGNANDLIQVQLTEFPLFLRLKVNND